MTDKKDFKNIFDKLKSFKNKTKELDKSKGKSHLILDSSIVEEVKQELNLKNNKDVAVLTEYLYLNSMKESERAKEKMKELEKRLGVKL